MYICILTQLLYIQVCSCLYIYNCTSVRVHQFSGSTLYIYNSHTSIYVSIGVVHRRALYSSIHVYRCIYIDIYIDRHKIIYTEA